MYLIFYFRSQISLRKLRVVQIYTIQRFAAGMKSFFKCVIYIVSKEMLDIFHTEGVLQIRWTF